MKIYIAKGFRKDVTSPKEIEMVALNKHKQDRKPVYGIENQFIVQRSVRRKTAKKAS